MESKILKDLTHYICVKDISSEGKNVSIVAEEQDIESINHRIKGCCKVLTFSSSVDLHFATGGDVLCVAGHVQAKIQTRCVVSLKSIILHMKEPIDVEYSIKDVMYTSNDETTVLPETLKGSSIDVYEVSLQTLILAMPLYPRAEHASVEDLYTAKTAHNDGTYCDSAFTVLKGLDICLDEK